MKKYKKIIFAIAIISLLIAPMQSLAVTDAEKKCKEMKTKGSGSMAFDVRCFTNLVANEIGFDVTEPIDDATLAMKIGMILGAGLAFLGALFTLLVIYSGILWMTARGNDEQIKKARNILRDALIGLLVVLGSGAIMYFINSNFIIKT